LKLKHREYIPKNYTGIVEYPSGNIHYYLNEKRHREDGPAIIYSDGTIKYFLNGEIHREDGPAVIWNDGKKYWYINYKNITEKVNNWLNGKTNIPPYEKWDNNTRLIFKLTFR